VDGKIFEGIKEAIAADRPAFLAAYLADFYNFDVLGGNRQCK
jgi:non-heme chloroperoxidase